MGLSDYRDNERHHRTVLLADNDITLHYISALVFIKERSEEQIKWMQMQQQLKNNVYVREGASYIHVAPQIRRQKSDGKLAQIWVNNSMGCFLFFGFVFVSNFHVARYRIESFLQNIFYLCNETGNKAVFGFWPRLCAISQKLCCNIIGLQGQRFILIKICRPNRESLYSCLLLFFFHAIYNIKFQISQLLYVFFQQFLKLI